VGFGDCRREAEGSAEGLLGGRKVFLVFLDGGQGEKGTVVVRGELDGALGVEFGGGPAVGAYGVGTPRGGGEAGEFGK